MRAIGNLPTQNPNLTPVMMGGEHGAARADIVNKSRLSSDLGPGMPLDAAQQMEKQGKDPQTIFQATGWYHAPDEKWKWIFHDSDAKLNRDAFLVYRTGGSGQSMGPKEQAEFDATHPERFDLRPGLDGAKISQVFDHPDLYALYPELKNATVSRMPWEVTQATGAVADYNPGNNSVRLAPGATEQDLLINLKHELQHGIQASEEFGPGSHLERYYPPGVTKLKLDSPEYRKAFVDYYRTSGEVEARQGSEEPNQDQLPTEMPGYPAPADQLVVHPGFLSGSMLGNLISGDKIVPGVSYKPVDHDPFSAPAEAGTPMKLTPVEDDPHKFDAEDPQYYQRNFERNSQWVRPGDHNYNTQLNPQEEEQFRQWMKDNKIPFQADEKVTDYDMRGFYKALQAGDPTAVQAVDPNDQRMHYPDKWKTPYAATFSDQSQWADPSKAPGWQGDQYVGKDGTVYYDDKTGHWVGPDAPWSPSPGATPLELHPTDGDPFAMPDSSHYQLPQQNQVPLPVVPTQPTAALSPSGPDNTNLKWSWGNEYAAPAPNNPADPQNIALNITQPQDYPNYAQAY